MTMHVDIRDHVVPTTCDGFKPFSHSLDVRLMQSHQAGMNAHTDGRQVEVVEQHRQMVMQSPARMKVQLQVARRGQSETAAEVASSSSSSVARTSASVAATSAAVAAAAILLAEPKLQLQRKLGPFDGLLQMSAVNCKRERGRGRWVESE